MKASQLQAQLAQAQLQALKMQLHPHFLFNTLHAISTLIHKDVEAADRMIARLSDLLRLSLENLGVQEVTLKHELEFLERYLEIEQIRFRRRSKKASVWLTRKRVCSNSTARRSVLGWPMLKRVDSLCACQFLCAWRVTTLTIAPPNLCS